MKTAIVWSIVVVAGCVDGDARDDLSSSETPVFGGEMQGRRLLGAFADGLAGPAYHFRVEASSINRMVSRSVDGAELVARNSTGAIVYRGADPMFIGLQMSGMGGGELEITSVATFGPSVSLYGLRYRASASALWKSYCKGTLAI